MNDRFEAIILLVRAGQLYEAAVTWQALSGCSFEEAQRVMEAVKNSLSNQKGVVKAAI